LLLSSSDGLGPEESDHIKNVLTSHQFRHNIGRGGPCCSNCTYAPHTIKLFTRLAHNFNTHAIINQLTRMSLLSTQVNSIHFMAKRRWLCVFWQHLHITTTSLLAKNAQPQTKMDNQLMESYNNIVRSALKRFLDHVQRDTSEWFYAINGDGNHPFSLCGMLGLSFDDTMMLLHSSGLTNRKSEA